MDPDTCKGSTLKLSWIPKVATALLHKTSSFISRTFFFFFFFSNPHQRTCLLISERWEGRERNINQLSFPQTPTGDRTHNLGMCPNQESTCHLSVYRTGQQSNPLSHTGQGWVGTLDWNDRNLNNKKGTCIREQNSRTGWTAKLRKRQVQWIPWKWDAGTHTAPGLCPLLPYGSHCQPFPLSSPKAGNTALKRSRVTLARISSSLFCL